MITNFRQNDKRIFLKTCILKIFCSRKRETKRKYDGKLTILFKFDLMQDMYSIDCIFCMKCNENAVKYKNKYLIKWRFLELLLP